MSQTSSKSKTYYLVLLFTSLYFISYITRINYGAVISEIIRQQQILKTSASLALTGSAITYGLGQLLSGFIGDKVQPKNVILTGLVVTILMNISMAFCVNPYQMTAVWSINGLAQAFMWPPLVKIMTKVLTEEEYKKSVVIVSWGSSFGTVMVYLSSPFIIYLGGWRLVFIVSAFFALIMLVIWFFKCPAIEMEILTAKKTHANPPFPWSFMLVGILIAIILQGYLRDGVATWIPSLVSETFNLSTNISIFTGIVFPVFSMLIYYLVSMIYRKAIHNELVLAGLFFAVGSISAAILALFHDNNTLLTVIASSLVTGSMHGVNLMLICMVPPCFSKYGRISFISGLLNSFTYVGSSISAYGMASYIEHFGWSSMAFFWSGTAITGAMICLLFSKKWSRFKA